MAAELKPRFKSQSIAHLCNQTVKVGINYEGVDGPTNVPFRSTCPKCGHAVWADETVDQDLHDGAALRRLREALPDDTRIEMWSTKWPDGMDGWGITLAMATRPPLGLTGDTIAEAADKCREALK